MSRQAEQLPRRTAHALHALLTATDESQMPPTSAEVVVFDEEALSARSTAAALCNARKHGLCFCMPSPDGNTWWITPAGYELRTAVEDRFLRDTERDHAAT